jgi:hypothetical protein
MDILGKNMEYKSFFAGAELPNGEIVFFTEGEIINIAEPMTKALLQLKRQQVTERRKGIVERGEDFR